jgi:hypothetical protein
MTQITIFTLWIILGIASAAAVPDPGRSRLGWAPMSVIFGPLWLLVAFERKQAIEAGRLAWTEHIATCSGGSGKRIQMESS